MKMINWVELTDLASPEMLIFASSEPQKLKSGIFITQFSGYFPSCLWELVSKLKVGILAKS